MMIGARTAAWSGKPLPYLRRVAYLESHGTEYIDTGLILSKDSNIVCEFNQFRSTLNDGRCFSASSRLYLVRAFEFVAKKDSLVFNYFGKNSLVSTVEGSAFFYKKDYPHLFTDDFHKCTVSPNSFKIDDVECHIDFGGRDSTTPCSCTLFCGHRSDGVETVAMEFQSVKIKSFEESLDGQLRMRFVPVISLGNEPCMYDEVSGQLFYNQGTGEFTWGELET